jgi:hypothetical protein
VHAMDTSDVMLQGKVNMKMEMDLNLAKIYNDHTVPSSRLEITTFPDDS